MLRSKSFKQLKREFPFCTLWCGKATVCKRVFILEWGRLIAKKKKILSKYTHLKTGTFLIENIVLLIIVCLPEGISGDLIWCILNAKLKLRRSLKSHVQGCENVVDSSHSRKLTTALNARRIGDTAEAAWGPLACSLTASLPSCLNVTHQQILISEVTLWCVFVCFFAWVIDWLYHLFAICN